MELKIKDLPKSEQPRERLINEGVKVLSNIELLAIILKIGKRKRKETALNLATRLLKRYQINKLSKSSVNELIKIYGIGKANACQIAACFELGRRVASFKAENRPQIKTVKDLADMLLAKMSLLDQEHFKGLYLDSRNRLIKDETIFIGSLNESLVHPREIFKIALAENAASVILVHNHPSGDPKPSIDDIKITKKIANVGKLIGVNVLDHVIIGANRYFSFAQKNLI